MNPIGREAIARLRQECRVARELGYGEGLLADIEAALTGLDIADKAMRAHMVKVHLSRDEDLDRPTWCQWDRACINARNEVLTEWNTWAQGGEQDD